LHGCPRIYRAAENLEVDILNALKHLILVELIYGFLLVVLVDACLEVLNDSHGLDADVCLHLLVEPFILVGHELLNAPDDLSKLPILDLEVLQGRNVKLSEGCYGCPAQVRSNFLNC
jgi:hypothetical protein